MPKRNVGLDWQGRRYNKRIKADGIFQKYVEPFDENDSTRSDSDDALEDRGGPTDFGFLLGASVKQDSSSVKNLQSAVKIKDLEDSSSVKNLKITARPGQLRHLRNLCDVSCAPRRIDQVVHSGDGSCFVLSRTPDPRLFLFQDGELEELGAYPERLLRCQSPSLHPSEILAYDDGRFQLLKLVKRPEKNSSCKVTNLGGFPEAWGEIDDEDDDWEACLDKDGKLHIVAFARSEECDEQKVAHIVACHAGKNVKVCEVPESASVLSLSADGMWCAYRVMVGSVTEEANRGEWYVCQLVEGAAPRKISQGPVGRVADIQARFSSDGAYVVYLANHSEDRPITKHMNLWLVDLQADDSAPVQLTGLGSRTRGVMPESLQIDAFDWIGDTSNTLWLSTTEGPRLNSYKLTVPAKVTLTPQSPDVMQKTMLEQDDFPSTPKSNLVRRASSPSGSKPSCPKASRRAGYAASPSKQQRSVFTIARVEPPAAFQSLPSWNPRTGKAVYAVESAEEFEGLWDESTGERTSLPQSRRLGDLRVEIIEWEGPGGLMVSGALYYTVKTSPGRRRVVVYAHGGPTMPWPILRGNFSNEMRRKEPNFTALLRAGYLVFVPLYRGTLGFGDKLSMALIGFQGSREGELGDILSGVSHVQRTHKLAARGPVGIFGESYGGYLTIRLLTDPVCSKVFKCGVAMYGYTNNRDMSFLTGDYTWEQEFIGELGNEPIVREEDISDDDLARISSPLLLLHGDEDDVCPLSHSEQVEVALRHRGVPTELKVYEGEGHGFKHSESMCDRDQRILEWFLQHLPPRTH